MATEAISPPTTPAPKLSRYRSVRKAQEQQAAQQHTAPPVPPVPPMPAVPEMQPAQQDAPVSRSMSRYHRRAPTAHATTPMPIPTPNPVSPPRSNTLQSHVAPPQPPSQPTTTRSRAVSSPHTSHSAHQRPRTAKQRADPSPPVTARQQSLKNDDSARQLLQKERERQRLLKEKYDAEARAQREAKQAEIDRLERIRREEEEAALLKAHQEAEAAEALRRQKEEQKAEQDRGKRLRKAEAQRMIEQREEDARRAKQEESDRKARLEQERARAQAQARKAPSASPPVSPPRNDPNLSLFRRKKDHSLSPEAPVTSARRAPSEEAIRPGGGGIVPGIDAPTSAVNAGDRRVTIVCGSKRIKLPVTPTTTPLDLIKMAATVLTEPIDVRTAVIQELFLKVSITRPLRNYEYVRDVMNSWDFDNQNDLTIIHADDGGIDQDDLLAYKVSETRPEGMSCMIQYSSRPGKWSKRYVTLKPDGQLVMSKNEKAKEKDQESILTMTDYDIYDVTQQKLQKVKPPKKICYAVKSLQKSNIFADESQYVHFFCTNDRATSLLFYKALQGWRSWYLKYELGEGLKKKAPTSRKVSDADAGKPISGPSHGHTRGESVGSHYQLGAFSSLLDLDDFNKKLDAIEVHKPGEFPEDKPLAGLGSRAIHARSKSQRVKHAPPISFNKSAPAIDSASQNMTRQPSVRRSMDRGEEETFSSGGLLGRGYTQRQAQAQEREQKQSGPSPFTEGPSLISGMDGRLAVIANDAGLNRRASTRSTHKRHSSDLTRSMSRRVPGMPEPLIDLTPQYKPPPQHANKGRGYNPTAGSGPLVESATSVEEAIQIPSSTDWRARPAAGRVQGMHGRTKSLKGRGEPLAAYTTNNHLGAPEDDRDAFTGGGLLSQAGYSQGHAPVGRGVMDGSKARGPMIDLRDSNNFASGSLLSALPDSNGPVIDRSGK